MAKIKIEGLEKLEKKLKANVTLNDVKNVVASHGKQLQARMQQKADFKMGYQTGATKHSIGIETKDAGFTVEVGATTEYHSYLEYGTRFMEAQPFTGPALEEQAPLFKSDLQKLVR